MHKVKLLGTAAAAALLVGIAGASAATSDKLAGSYRLAQSSSTDMTTGSPSGKTMGAETGTAPSTTGGTTGTEGSTMGQTTVTTPISEQELAARADQIIGQEVVDRQGEEIGEIEDLVVDQNGQGYAVIGVGGFLGIGEHEVAVPATNLEFGASQTVYTGLGGEADLKAMPEYKEGTWRSLKK